MGALKRIIPLWMKSTIAVFLTEIGRWPIRIVFSHMRRCFAQSGGCGVEGQRRAEQAVQKNTYAWVRKHYGALAEAQAKKYTLGHPTENVTVWVFWWQGEENAPAIVQRCIASIRKHAGRHPVQVIDQWNYMRFVSVPAHVEERRRNGKMTLTHFSDYLRMALLARHGGLWLDATIFASAPLDTCFEGDLFTVRNPGFEKENISRWEWSVFAIGGNAGCSLFVQVRDLLSAYWEDNDRLVDYYVFDYMVRLVVDNCPGIQNALESVEPNNPNTYFYQQHFNDTADLLPPDDTWLYKLSWKGTYNTITPAGEETVYGRWLRETENPI